MFIFTARIPKKRLLAGGGAALVCALAVLAALALTLGQRAVTASGEVAGIRDNEDRVAYLTGLGWQVSPQPAAQEKLLIPEAFDASYASYLSLQRQQGFDLERYCGKRVTRYVYEIANYPTGEAGVQAALLVYKNKVIGGQVQAADGSFLHALSASVSPSPTPSSQG